jgi:hypothetical protein
MKSWIKFCAPLLVALAASVPVTTLAVWTCSQPILQPPPAGDCDVETTADGNYLYVYAWIEAANYATGQSYTEVWLKPSGYTRMNDQIYYSVMYISNNSGASDLSVSEFKTHVDITDGEAELTANSQ